MQKVTNCRVGATEALMKPALFLIAASILNGADVTGHYYLKGVMEVASELLLHPDGKFEFMLTYGAADYWGKGTWKAGDGGVVLNSDPSNPKDVFVLLKSEAGKAGETRVKLVGAEGRVVPNVDLFFLVPGEKSVKGRTDFDGAAVFPSNAEKRAIVWELPVYDYHSKPWRSTPGIMISPSRSTARG